MEPLEQLAILNEPACCKDGEFYCRNSPSNSSHPKCNDCRLSPAVDPLLGIKTQHWKPISSRYKHHVLEQEKHDAKRLKTLARQEARKTKDPSRQARNRAAERAERRTEQAIIKSTKNSGRSNRDGDHVFNDKITLDTKLQSNAVNPVVNLQELDKVRSDARRSGKQAGALVIQNKTGRSVVVFDLADFAAAWK